MACKCGSLVHKCASSKDCSCHCCLFVAFFNYRINNNNDSQLTFCDGDHNDDDDSRCSTADETESVTNIRFGFLNILLDGSYESDSNIATNCGTDDCYKGMAFK